LQKPRPKLRQKLIAKLLVAGLMVTPLFTSVYAEEEKSAPESVQTEEATPKYDFDEIVVTATKTEKSIKKVSASISVITREMIEESPLSSITDILSTLPGVSVEKRSGLGTTAGISIRGLNGGPGSQKMLLLIDGRTANFAFNGNINWNAVPKDMIERIEVIRGPASALYGANATGGVINIITKKPEKDSTTINARYGSFNTQIYSLTQIGRDDRLGYVFTAETGRSNGPRDYSDYDGQNYSLRLDFDANENTTWSLMAGIHNSDRNIAGSKTRPNGFYREEADANYLDLQAKIIGEKTTDIFRVYTNASETQDTKSGSLTTPDSRMKDRTSGFMYQRDMTFKADDVLTVGLDYQKQTATDIYNRKDYDANTSAFYAQYDRNLNEKLNMNLGVRSDHHSAYGNQFSPKLGFSYQTSPDTRVRLNIAKAFKAPSLADLYSASGSNRSNPDLKPTEMWAYELGLEKQFNEATLGKVVFYYNDITDLVINKQFVGYRQKVNVGKMVTQGVEVELNRKISKYWDAFVNYTYLDVGDMTYLSTHHKANLGAVYKKFPYKVSLSTQYVGDSWGSDNFKRPIPDYTTANIKVTYEPNKNYELSLGIENIFDKYYEVYLDYPMPGRVYTVDLKLKF
jgi:outer membrane cobalamin receptor